MRALPAVVLAVAALSTPAQAEDVVLDASAGDRFSVVVDGRAIPLAERVALAWADDSSVIVEASFVAPFTDDTVYQLSFTSHAGHPSGIPVDLAILGRGETGSFLAASCRATHFASGDVRPQHGSRRQVITLRCAGLEEMTD